MGTFVDKTGQKFNMLTAKEYLGNSYWLCDCACGTKGVKVKSSLLNEVPGRNKQKSCGCLRRKNTPDREDFFDKIESQEQAYILGFIAADGTVQPELNRIKIDIKDIDEDILVKIQKVIGHHNNLSNYVNKNRKFDNSEETYDCRISRLVISSKRIVEEIQKFGVVPNKSNIMEINFDLIPKELWIHFIRGYFDGDGCLSYSVEKKYTDLTFTSSTKTVIQIQQILENEFGNGHKFYLYHRKLENPDNGTIIATYKPMILDILNAMYEDATIYLDRKYNKYLEFLEDYNYCK